MRTMKGSVGVSAGISAGVRSAGVSAGMRASGGRIGPSKSIGGSLSPEARFGSTPSKFSSRGLSHFNRSPIAFKEIGGKKSPNSIININKGLNRPKGMFDVSRPVRLHPVSRPPEFGVSIHIKNGREAKSPKARSQSLTSPRPMFDMSRKPVPEFGKRMPTRRVDSVVTQKQIEKPLATPYKHVSPRKEYKTVAQRTREVGFNPRVRSERVKSINPFKDTIVLWQRSDVSPRVKLESAARRYPNKEKRTVLIPAEKAQVFPRRTEIRNVQRTREIIRSLPKIRPETQPRKKTEKAKAPKRLKVGNVISINHDVSPEVRALVRQDIKDAKVILIPSIMKARGVSYQTAFQEAVQILARKHEGKVKVRYETFMIMEHMLEEKKKQEEEEKQNAQQKEAIQKKNNKKMPDPGVGEESLLYFKKDIAANEKRKDRFIKAFQKLLKYRKDEDLPISGYDVIKEAGEIPEAQEISELTRPQGIDYRYHNFVYFIKAMSNVVRNPKNFLAALDSAIYKYSAIKLSTKEDADAKGVDAMEVYGKPLNWVDANIEELEWKKWKLKAYVNSKKVRLIKNHITT